MLRHLAERLGASPPLVAQAGSHRANGTSAGSHCPRRDLPLSALLFLLSRNTRGVWAETHSDGHNQIVQATMPETNDSEAPPLMRDAVRAA